MCLLQTYKQISSYSKFLGILRVVLVMFICSTTLQAQNKSQDTLTQNTKINNTHLKNDSLTSNILQDSTKKSNINSNNVLNIKISDDALEEIVVATASDSADMDMITNNFNLYGNAKVDYEGKILTAPFISLNQKTNTAFATMRPDSAYKKQIPNFEQGEEKLRYDSLQYNLKSQRAIIFNAHTQYGEGYIISQQIKRNEDKSFYGYKNIYTTCALDHPHFGIKTNRIKVIPDIAIASGSANVEVEGVPTPIFFPFGYFPINSESHRSGFIIPTYTTEANRGLGFLKGGYYFHFNDYVDAQLQADIFTKGSIAGYLTSNYIKRYRYNGNLFVSYALNKTGEEFDPNAKITKDFAIRWSHTKDPKSLPGVNFNANVNIQSGNFYAYNSYNTNQILQNQFQSNITFSKSWAGKPYSLTISATHNQNTANKQVNISLPEATFYVNALTPFKRKKPIGAAQWYEKITVGYALSTVNRITFYDSAFSINNLKFSDFRNGIRHTIPINANYNVLRFFVLSFNTNYNEYWNTMKTFRQFNALSNKIDTNYDYGFAPSRDFNSSLSLNTQIYGMKMFKHGVIRGIRHTIRPSVGLSYRPDFAKSPFDYYYQTRLDSSRQITYLSPYEQSIIGLPPQGRNGSVTMGINNNLQMKVRNGKDTLTGFKNISLLDALDINTAYNIAADSFQWDYYRLSARTNIANLLNISAAANFDPYQWNYQTNRRMNKTFLSEGKGLARLSTANIGFGTSIRSKNRVDKRNDTATKTDDYKSLMRNDGMANYVDFNIPWSINLTYSFNLERRPSIYSLKDSSIKTQNITINGDFNFTPRWKVAFSTGYDLTNKQITFSSIDIYRDLHCWEMRLGLIPFGYRKSFNFTLNVKAQILQDLRLVRRRDFRDAIN